jgi:hypothetical protein
MDDDYTPTPGEERIARELDAHIEALLNGQLSGLGFCAVNTKGEESFFYINKPQQAVLMGPMSKLIGLYKTNTSISQRTTAPKTNMSYRSH